MALYLDPTSTYKSILNDSLGVPSRLSDYSARRLTRKQRNDLYRSTLKANRMPKEIREYYKRNPDAHGLPRAYDLRFEEPTVKDHESLSALNGTKLLFGRFGDKSGGLELDGHKIDPSCLKFQPATNTYTFQAKLPVPVDGRAERIIVSGYFNFDSAIPTGSLQVDNRVFRITLKPEPLKFKAKVSANAGAAWSTGTSTLTWDSSSKTWNDATWEPSMEFAYQTVRIEDPILGNIAVIENYFTDKSSDPPSTFNLTADNSSDFTCILNNVDGKLLMQTTALKPKEAPSSRHDSEIKSVFPLLFVVEFNPFGGSFDGAYKTHGNNVYAVQGDVILDDVPNLLLPALASRKLPLPANDILSPLGISYQRKGSDPPLNISSILGNDPMVPNKDNPGEYSDSVAQVAMKDFRDIIVYYMDDNLRKLFISASPPTLIPDIRSIAESDLSENSKFYKKLQVPFLTTMLSESRVEEGQSCNGKRAQKLLEAIPADDPVYKSQSSKLYRFRYLEKFPSTKKFLDDQRNRDYSNDIDKIAKVMKDNLAKSTADFEQTNHDYQTDLKKAQEDIDKLGKWCKERNLYWAFYLLYYIEKVTLPTWYDLYTTGNMSSSLGMNIKKLNGLFGVLENNQVNTTKDGMNFMEAFNGAVRMFQMSSIIPQLVDMDESSSDFDSIVKACLEEFYNQYKDSSDPNIAEQANLAKQLFSDDELRWKFFGSLKKLQRLFGAGVAAWTVLMKQWENVLQESWWFKILKGGSKIFALMQKAIAATMLIIVLIPHFWNLMGPGDKTVFVIAAAGLIASLTVKIAQGAVRLFYLWKDISGWKDVLKCVFGFEKVVDKIPNAANNISSNWARFFTRTAKQTVAMAGDEVATGASSFSRLSKMFGRNMGEVLGTVIGVILAIVSIVLTAMALAKGEEDLMIVADVMIILSASIQLLATVAGWVVASGISLFTGAITALSLVATWGGPVAFVFALIGVIIMIVFMVNNKPVNPVQEFVNNYVKPAGLYMDHTAIDYFDAIAATDKTASRVGVSILGARAADNEPASTSEQVYLRLNVKDEDSGTINHVKDLDFTTDTVWSLRTDGYGRSQIYTQKYIVLPGTEQERMRTVWFLSATDDEKDLIVRRLPNKQTEEEKYQENLPYTLWNITVVADPERDSDSAKPIKALCDISYTTRSRAAVKHFVLQSDPASKKPIKFLLADTASSTPKVRLINKWLFGLESLGPVPFKYRKDPWQISTDQRDERNNVLFEDGEATSSGYHWSVNPSLNSKFLELVTKPPEDEGMIQMKDGAKPEKMPKKSYTVTCKLMKDGKEHGKQVTAVDIEVVDPPTHEDDY